jgi:hypothetical protein
MWNGELRKAGKRRRFTAEIAEAAEGKANLGNWNLELRNDGNGAQMSRKDDRTFRSSVSAASAIYAVNSSVSRILKHSLAVRRDLASHGGIA